METKKQLTKDEKTFVKNAAKTGRSAIDIANDLNMSGNDMYISDDFCIAFADGRKES